MVSSSSNGPVVVVIGATGAQGGSVVQHLVGSDKNYQIVAVTRDTTKPASKALADQGVKVVSANVDSRDDLDRVFKGANIVFAVTNFWEHMNFGKEVEDGKRIVDAAKAAGVSHFIWSGLEPVSQVSGGKYKHAVITTYARESGLPTSIVQAASYMQNFETLLAPRKQPDGSLVFAVPMTPQSKIALLDTKADYGAYVREVIEGESFGPGSDVLACAEELSLEEIVSQFNEVTGAKATYHQLAHDDFLAVAGPAGQEILEMLLWFQDFGYFGGKDIAPSQKELAVPVKTWRDFVRQTKWEVLA
ncbi:NAD(P)-binding protein [Rhodotorula diobovata]|uniref:NAD(P)-binding protein n=1 Tax=Rhodotorula diobovata TaxID=5288 RepID=A0A5C5G0A6_9BASI|nr:NAD(P)-binding protein [Rhodotorula diobovata]